VRVVNDAEIALYAGSERGWGIVAIAGTGGNILGKTPEGVIRQVGGLGYEYGDYGSGIDMARDVLHHAFRSAELRGPKTSLERTVLNAFGVADFPTLSRAIYLQKIVPEAFLMLAPLCFQAAREQDAVAIDILQRQGIAIGESIVGCARLLKLETVALDVVLAGSLWLGTAPHMREALRDVVNRDLPLAQVQLSELRPVAGAALMASQTPGLRAVLREDFRFRGVE
jgi:N-acetylglucosamine kinase-like BadF-type ATPase